MNEESIIFEDEHILVLNKPSGMPSQPDQSGEKALLELADEYTGCVCHILTRLDRPVEGLVLFAKDAKTAALLSSSLKDTEKSYEALVCGEAETEAVLEDYLMHNKRSNLTKPVNKNSAGAKFARLFYRRLSYDGEHSLLEIKLDTGRHHQIRVQLAGRGLPIVGDTKYNPKYKHKRGVKLMLCCKGLKFTHPYTNETVELRLK